MIILSISSKKDKYPRNMIDVVNVIPKARGFSSHDHWNRQRGFLATYNHFLKGCLILFFSGDDFYVISIIKVLKVQHLFMDLADCFYLD